MNKEELGYVLETIRFKTSIYRDKKKRNLSFNDDDYYSNILNEYINDLQQENKKYKEVIFKIKMIISARIKEYQKKIDNEIDMGSQGDHFKICRYEENIKFLKDILKEVE